MKTGTSSYGSGITNTKHLLEQQEATMKDTNLCHSFSPISSVLTLL